MTSPINQAFRILKSRYVDEWGWPYKPSKAAREEQERIAAEKAEWQYMRDCEECNEEHLWCGGCGNWLGAHGGRCYCAW